MQKRSQHPKRPPLSYAKSGVDISETDKAKRAMASAMETGDMRVLNRIGAFASLYDGSFPEYEHPVLVLKTEEPGSKQVIAFEHDRIESICEDMIHHLINDIAVMGATPLSIQDLIVCGSLDKKIIHRIVKGIARACRAQGCSLTGGETSVQPGVLPSGRTILGSSIVGVVEKSRIIDGSAIEEGDAVLAVASNGLHTNGYTLVRKLVEAHSGILKEKIQGESFLEAILRPHVCYYQALQGLFGMTGLHGLAHITGGGIAGNVSRILPEDMDAKIDLGALRILPIFALIRKRGNVHDRDMLQTFNMGAGLTIVCDPEVADAIMRHLREFGHDAYPIGTIVTGAKRARYEGNVQWP